MKTKDEKKQTDSRGLVPKLRFPEFRDKGAWEEKHLRDLAKRITRKNKTGAITRVLTNSAENGVVNQRDYFDKNIANQSNLGGYFIVDEGDYVYNPRVSNIAPVGPISKNKLGKGVMSPLYTVFRFKNRNNDFFEQYFKTTHWHHYLRMVSNSGARHDRMSITNGDFEIMPLPFPVPAEQQKIADCLSSLDELIAAQTHKLDTLKDHKKGLMQQLFPNPGQTTPTLRFPEFQDSGEWKVNPLGKKLLTSPEYGINAPAVPYSENLPTYLRITDISEDGYFLEKQKVSVAKEVIANNYLRKGDITLARTGASVGKAYRYRESDGELVFAGFLIRIRPDQKKLATEFLFHFLSTEQYWTWVSFTSARSGQPGINGKEYASLPVPLPPTMSEQQKIADCLSSLDELIAAQTHKLDAFKDHKKGLMQKLFPNPDEVVG